MASGGSTKDCQKQNHGFCLFASINNGGNFFLVSKVLGLLSVLDFAWVVEEIEIGLVLGLVSEDEFWSWG